MNTVRMLAGCLVLFCMVGAATAAIPIRKYDIHEVIAKVVPATEAEKKEGVLVTVFFKGRKEGVRVTKDTAIHRQMGKLVPEAEARDITAGQKLSVWVGDKKGVAEAVLIFP
jgi:hypothetical protein